MIRNPPPRPMREERLPEVRPRREMF